MLFRRGTLLPRLACLKSCNWTVFTNFYRNIANFRTRRGFLMVTKNLAKETGMFTRAPSPTWSLSAGLLNLSSLLVLTCPTWAALAVTLYMLLQPGMFISNLLPGCE